LASGAGRDEGLEVLLRPYLPNDHARQVTAGYYVDTLMRAHPSTPIVMDLGCGAGDSVDLFRAYDRDVDWVGVDIVGSPEGRQRTREDAKYVTYDGVTLPFEAGTFDLIFSRQVLEHVRDPLAHLREVARVLRIGGSFIGSTSQLEPYHSRSYWNFTVFGFAELVAEAGLELLELRPGIDGMTLIERSYRGRPASFDRWFEDESPLNVKIDATSGKNRSVADVNLRKLTYAGHFAFHTLRPST
jgi:SAM-dependent methyltransferase